jgi:adenosine deaminase CECR1
MEVLAGKLLSKIREHERIDPQLYGNLPSEAIPEASTRDMGGHFLTNKPRIERSTLFRIAREMPKGAHLHLHFNAVLHPSELLLYARRPTIRNTLFIRATQALLHRTDYEKVEIVFGVHPQDIATGDIFSVGYDPQFKLPPNTTAWMRWVDFRHRFNSIKVTHLLGDRNSVTDQSTPKLLEDSQNALDPAEQWVCHKITLTSTGTYDERQTTNGIWACFNQSTRAFKGLLNYEGVYRWYIGRVIDSMIDDKVMYAELRPMLLDKSIPSDDGTKQLDHRAQMSIVCEEVERKLRHLRARDQLHLFPFGLKIIYCTPRSIDRSKMRSELMDCLTLKMQFPDLICGFDLVGAEDRRNSIGFYADLLVAFANTCKELNITIPFLFHAGESLLDTGGSRDPNNSNLYDAFILNSKRIGHGYALLRHPMLLEKYKQKGICIELCPISNELLHLCGNSRQHVFSEILAAGLHCTLNADNPALFR